ncbi:DUF1743 domain-containing protein [Methanosalsum natronophilum]|uniref:DUF1743 domain-containing protein n=2 Tax=Methanosalsum natronophilum TaxID=768733 RepID=A0A3R7VU45_9EURY|nr:MAG: DUF1743 domain-containing protein [Methanosalsum natronophilum]
MKKVELSDPYTVPYKKICAICDEKNEIAEIIEFFDCYGGAAWSRYHYSNSPLVEDAYVLGDTIRYLVKTGQKNLNLKPSTAAAGIESFIVKDNEAHITYSGLGGGGVGATKCRSSADGILRSSFTDSGGSRVAKGTIVVPRMERLIIGIDDTDSKEEGATWSLCHNIAKEIDSHEKRYLSHSLVQLYPVPTKTQNCVATVLEFGCSSEKAKDIIIDELKNALLKYSVSNETGMVAISSFSADKYQDYSKLCRTRQLTKAFALDYAKKNQIKIILNGNGVIGALAALAWVAKSDQSIIMEAD